mgnify:CR=1 FL=1|jgi:hypothetical protein
MPNNTTLTAETITTAQIKALRAEAEAAGDRAQVDLCDLALAAHETADAQGGDLIGPDGAIWTRTEAREACADAINAGQG